MKVVEIFAYIYSRYKRIGYTHENKTNVKLTLINQNKNVLPNQLFIVYFVNEGKYIFFTFHYFTAKIINI